MDWLDIEMIAKVIGGTLETQVGQFTVAFGLAAWIHAGRVKKEIRLQGAQFVDAMNNLSAALRQDLANHSNRIEKVEIQFDELKGRVLKLEKPKK